MKLYSLRNAPNPRRVRIFLAEKGIEIPCEDRPIDSLKEPEFTALNPMQRVPVLVLDDGSAICESVAICRYFEELHPEPALFGRGAKGRAEVEMWNRRAELGLLFPVAQVFRHLHPAMTSLEVPQVAAWGEANRPKALAALDALDARLAASRYIAGEDYSIADITALVAVDFMKPARIARPPELGHLARWYAEVASRPSAKA